MDGPEDCVKFQAATSNNGVTELLTWRQTRTAKMYVGSDGPTLFYCGQLYGFLQMGLNVDGEYVVHSHNYI